MLSREQKNRFRGYEHMISAYFEALAKGVEAGQKQKTADD
jgi:hypothetical protein